jgi:Na+/H+ antiporter NhaD/arsenite permease-like protein
LIWGRKLHTDAQHRERVMRFDEREALTDIPLLRYCLVVLTAVLLAFVFARPLHLEPATIALAGAALLLLLDNWRHGPDEQGQKVHHAFAEVEWVTIFFFLGLFIVVHGVDSTGLLRDLAHWLVGVTGGDMTVTALAILWVSAIASAVIDNIPFVATMIPLIKSMAPTFGGPDALMPLWWSLSLGACLGGNGTLVGASANLVVAGIAERNGQPIRFLAFTLMAFPLMLLSMVISTVYVYLRFL